VMPRIGSRGAISMALNKLEGFVMIRLDSVESGFTVARRRSRDDAQVRQKGTILTKV
jgi:hypothetical protein